MKATTMKEFHIEAAVQIGLKLKILNPVGGFGLGNDW